MAYLAHELDTHLEFKSRLVINDYIKTHFTPHFKTMNDLALSFKFSEKELAGHRGRQIKLTYSDRGCVHYTPNELRVALVGHGLFHLMLLPRFERR